MTTPRRRFLGTLAAVPLAPAAVALPQAAAPTPTPSPASAAPNPVAEALAEVATRRYGAHFESGDAEAVLKLVTENLKAAERLQARKLGNADEPVTVFAARPRPAKRGARR
ncbi:MAG TPA: hypothetical protein VN375_16770 [Vicinamibacteria bacterium]|jgi:hypothetical protein|nr:hypothetical protein [Vicinamibacteria bacterium]